MTTPQTDQRLERGQRTRDRLVEEGVRLFALKGFEAVSTRELALACGVNAAAINFHFGSKAGLYEAVIGRVASTIAVLYGETVLAASKLTAGAQAVEHVRSLLARMTADLLRAPRSRWMSLLIQRELIAPSDAFERIYETALHPVLVALERAVTAVSCAPDGDSRARAGARPDAAHVLPGVPPAGEDATPPRADGSPMRANATSERADASPARADDPQGRADRTKTLAFALFAMISSFSRSRETYLKWTDRDAYTPEDAGFIGGVLADFAVSGLAVPCASLPATPPASRTSAGDRP